MANSASHAALPYPVKGARYTVQIPYLDADGDPTDPTTPDTEVSKDGGAYADCAEEVTTITGSNGSAYMTLTGAEMDASMVFLAAKAASGPKNTLITLFPRVLPVLESGTATAGSASSITVVSSAYRVGCIVRTTGGTGGGGTGGANNQARMVTSQSGAVLTVTPNWETTPDNTTTYEVLMTEMAALLTPLAATADANRATFWGNGGNVSNSLVGDTGRCASSVFYSPTTATRTIGSNQGGTVADLATLDGTTFSTGEDATNGLEVNIELTSSPIDERPFGIQIRGNYSGAAGHSVSVQVYNNDTAGYETLATMTNNTTAQDYRLTIGPDHQDGSGKILLKFKHSVGTYIAAHRLHLDYIGFEKSLLSLTAEDISTQLDTDGFLKATTAANNTVDVTATGAVGIDWGNIENKTTTVALTNTTISASGGALSLTSAYEGAETLQDYLRLSRAVLLGKTTGNGTQFRDKADTKNRVTVTIDTGNNRTSITTDAT